MTSYDCGSCVSRALSADTLSAPTFPLTVAVFQIESQPVESIRNHSPDEHNTPIYHAAPVFRAGIFFFFFKVRTGFGRSMGRRKRSKKEGRKTIGLDIAWLGFHYTWFSPQSLFVKKDLESPFSTTALASLCAHFFMFRMSRSGGADGWHEIAWKLVVW